MQSQQGEEAGMVRLVQVEIATWQQQVKLCFGAYASSELMNVEQLPSSYSAPRHW